ncbi:MAG TPA: zinc-binding dehydrogenase [Candidatus Binatia bacterium]|jgi:NADPH:quinone reductase-like Zn-dependent oxidoreductase
MHKHGGADQLFFEDAEEPRCDGAAEAIVKLSAAALNHIDIWNRLGLTGVRITMPHILGADGAGVVVDVTQGVEHVRVGDRVCLYPATGCGQCEFCRTDRDFMCIRLRVLGERLAGTYAQYVKLPARNCFPIPTGYSFEEAAAFPLVFITLWRMLITNARLEPGETILILGIGGGVASASLQVAKKIGARVIVTSRRNEKLERAQDLGADYGINHASEDFVQEVQSVTADRGVDVVLDSIGGEFWRKSLAALARGGRLVTCGATAGAAPIDDIAAISSKELKIYGSTLGSREEFRQVINFLNSAKIKPVIDSIFPLENTADAQLHLENARQFGKIVLRIPD